LPIKQFIFILKVNLDLSRFITRDQKYPFMGMSRAHGPLDQAPMSRSLAFFSAFKTKLLLCGRRRRHCRSLSGFEFCRLSLFFLALRHGAHTLLGLGVCPFLASFPYPFPFRLKGQRGLSPWEAPTRSPPEKREENTQEKSAQNFFSWPLDGDRRASDFFFAGRGLSMLTTTEGTGPTSRRLLDLFCWFHRCTEALTKNGHWSALFNKEKDNKNNYR
jgi:hypothetical protein